MALKGYGAALILLTISPVLSQLDLGPTTNQIVDTPRQSTFIQPGYLPPIEGAGAQNDPIIATTQKPAGPTHHGRDLCTDPFHSFLCAPLKPRKLFTGAVPSQNLDGANTFEAPSKVLAPPYNELYEAPSTSTERPTTTTTTTKRPTTTTTTRRPTTTTTTTKRPITTEKPVEPAPSNVDRSYLPPDVPESIAPAAAAPDPAIASPDEHEEHHHDHPHHHGRDLCSDPFHSFLCQPLKPRKRITGDLPNSLFGANSFLVPKKAKPDPEVSPQPSNEVDRAYLPPSTTTRRPKPSFQVRPEPSNELNRIIYTTTTTKRPTPLPTTIRPEPSNEIDRVYLPPVTTRRTTTTTFPTTFRFRPQPSNDFQRFILRTDTTPAPTYLPPEIPQPSNDDPIIQPAPAQESPAIASPDHDHHHGSHGFKDICSDPFHSFLCVSPKPRKRITGELPPGFRGDSSNRQETKVRQPTQQLLIVVPPLPSTTLTTTTTTTPKPIQTAESRETNPIFQQPDPSPSAITTGYEYPKPENSQLDPKNSYNYPKPSSPFPLPTQGYEYPKPEKKLPLPSEIKPVVGYDYPKPSSPLPLPSKGYDYPKPSTQLPLPTKGYDYPKPENKLPLPSENKLGFNKVASQTAYPKPLRKNSSFSPNEVAKPVKPFRSQEPTESSKTEEINKPKPKTIFPASIQEAKERLKGVTNIGTQNSSSDLILVNDVDFPAEGALPVRFGDRLKRRQPRRHLPLPA